MRDSLKELHVDKKDILESPVEEEIHGLINHPQIKAVLDLLQEKDPYTYQHSLRVADLCLQLGKYLGLNYHERFEIYACGLLHDIGKYYTPDNILKKPGPLTAQEFAVMKTHPIDSERMAKELCDFNHLCDPIRGHHERFDGKGYPDKKKGYEIHFYSRIILVCDTFDAMTSTRVYRRELDLARTYTEIISCAGTQFDPELALAFVTMHQERMTGAKQRKEAA